MGKIMLNEINYTGGGSGTSSLVTPNPQGTPTDTLNTIGINGTIFDIGGGATNRELVYTLQQGGRWETFTDPESEYPLIIEMCGGYGIIDKVELIASKLPTRSGGDYYVTIATLPQAQGQQINMARLDNDIYISSSGSFDSSEMYIKVYKRI